jgi:hypothetical protein
LSSVAMAATTVATPGRAAAAALARIKVTESW